MHELQKQILSGLSKQEKCRYRDLKPSNIDGNLFTYHLGSLVKDNLVEKNGLHYQLTAEGMRYISSLSLRNLRPRIQPKIVTLIACKDKGEWLLYRRNRQPFKGLVGFPYGKIHLGETIAGAANRELEEKTGLKANLTHCGEVYLTIFKEEELISHMLCHVFRGTDPIGSLQQDTEIGDCFWARLTDPQSAHFFPGFGDIFSLVSKEQPKFFKEFTYHI